MDARQLHEESLTGWDSVAPAWLEYAGEMRTKVAAVSNWMLDRLELDRAGSVLELACGAGDLSVQIAQRLQNTATFIASDFAPQMVSAAKQNASNEGIDGIDFRVLDAQAIDLPDGSVEVATCRFGYMLMPEPDKAFAETHRVLRAGGRAVPVVWGALERNAWLMAFGMALMQSGQTGQGDPYEPGGVFSLSDPKLFQTKLEDAGFKDVDIEEIAFTYDFDDFDSYWTMQSKVAGSAAQHLEALPEEDRAAIKETARTLSESFAGDSGYAFPALALGAVARK